MIFRIKQCWWLALLVTLAWSWFNTLIGGWAQVPGDAPGLVWQIMLGLLGAGLGTAARWCAA